MSLYIFYRNIVCKNIVCKVGLTVYHFTVCTVRTSIRNIKMCFKIEMKNSKTFFTSRNENGEGDIVVNFCRLIFIDLFDIFDVFVDIVFVVVANSESYERLIVRRYCFEIWIVDWEKISTTFQGF